MIDYNLLACCIYCSSFQSQNWMKNQSVHEIPVSQLIECLVLVSGVLLHIDSLFFFLHTLKTVKNIKAIKVLAECAQKFLFGAQKRNETLENATLLDIFLDLHCIISTDQFYGFERVNTRESTRNRNINRMRC